MDRGTPARKDALQLSAHQAQQLDEFMERLLRASRIPGAAIAVIGSDRAVYARGFGYRDRDLKKPVTPDTTYPIASTTKAINAAMLGALVEEGYLDWDVPVQHYMPRFRLKDAAVSSRVTLRDLVTMITGLPRHDAAWEGNAISRAALVERMQHLDLSCDFRRRFQYCNLSVTASGHIAEIVTGKSWETLLAEKIFRPLSMRRTGCPMPVDDNATLSYHENVQREVILTKRRPTEATGPSGGSVHSTVEDMARWVTFNLDGRTLDGRTLDGRRSIDASTLAQLHAPQVIIGDRALSRMPPDGAYAMGWLVDHHQGHRRISHGGYVHDLNSSVMLFPKLNMGLVSFVNFGCHALAPVINEYIFSMLLNVAPGRTFEQVLTQYEKSIDQTREQYASIKRVAGTAPSRPLDAYLGRYTSRGYGTLEILRQGSIIAVQWHDVLLPLRHWHYDVWIAEDHDMWTIHLPHIFDPLCQMQFHADAKGAIEAVTLPLESTVAPIRFERLQAMRERAR